MKLAIVENNTLTESQARHLLAEAMLDRIETVETKMMECAQVVMPVTDRFADGMYVREITIPAGTLLTGRVHLREYVDIMLNGDILVATPEGVKRLTGDNVMIGSAGRKRIGYALQDTRWVTVHNCPVKDGDEYVNKHTVFGMKEYNALLEAPKCQ